jgi:hypothetical protein
MARHVLRNALVLWLSGQQLNRPCNSGEATKATGNPKWPTLRNVGIRYSKAIAVHRGETRPGRTVCYSKKHEENKNTPKIPKKKLASQLRRTIRVQEAVTQFTEKKLQLRTKARSWVPRTTLTHMYQLTLGPTMGHGGDMTTHQPRQLQPFLLLSLQFCPLKRSPIMRLQRHEAPPRRACTSHQPDSGLLGPRSLGSIHSRTPDSRNDRCTER